jgi:serine/threonine-protein kinase HipA
MVRHGDRLYISAGGVAAGTLGRNEERRHDSVFSYNAAVGKEYAVSLTMPVRLESYGWEYGIHPLFEMLIPGGHLKDELVRRFSKTVQDFDDFALLGIVGPYQLGRISLRIAPTQKRRLFKGGVFVWYLRDSLNCPF